MSAESKETQVARKLKKDGQKGGASRERCSRLIWTNRARMRAIRADRRKLPELRKMLEHKLKRAKHMMPLCDRDNLIRGKLQISFLFKKCEFCNGAEKNGRSFFLPLEEEEGEKITTTKLCSTAEVVFLGVLD